ncbi:MAG: methyltransferase domain-containing protein [Acidimicrobiia bacterium]
MRAELVELLRCPRSGGPLRLEVLEADGGEVEAGLLHGDGGTYPVVAGIPVFRDGDEEVVDLLRAGDPASAAALAVGGRLPRSRAAALVPVLAELRPTRAVSRRLARRLQRAATGAARAALDAAVDDPDALLRLTHLEHRRPNAEGYNYFRYRLGLPKHLVALAAVAAAEPGPGPVLEVGCGAGHLTWQMAATCAPRPVVALDRELDLLWIARHHLAPGADQVCGDAISLPFPDGTFSLGTAFDVMSFVTAKAVAARELARVVAPGGGTVLSSLINASVAHVFAGEPLSVEGWRRLVGADHVALADREVLEAYLAGRTPPATSSGDDVLAGSRTLTLLAGPAATAGLDRALEGWPHARGRLGPHPLLRTDPAVTSGRRFARWSPSEGFARDNGDLDLYLPDELVLSGPDVTAARTGAPTPAVEAAVATAALIGYPERWPADPWSSTGSG